MRELIVTKLVINLSSCNPLKLLLHPFNLTVTQHTAVVLLHQLHEITTFQRIKT
jgi:hypothetical protein